MDLERLPSGKFDTNALVLKLAIIAYNILNIIAQNSLKSRRQPMKTNVKRRHIRTVIRNHIKIAGHITTHAGIIKLALGKSNAWSYVFLDVLGLIQTA